MLGGFGVQLFGKVTGLRTDLDAHIALTTGIHGAVSAATASKLVIRDGSGRFQAVDPNVAADVATKNYVDTTGNAGTVTQVLASTGVQVSPATSGQANYTLSLTASGVSAGSYTIANVTVDAQGRVTSASNGFAVVAVSGTAPVVASGSSSITVSMPAATASVNGYMTTTQVGKLNGISTGADVSPISTVFGRTGAVVAATNDYTIQKIDGVTVSTASPSGGSNGDLWFRTV